MGLDFKSCKYMFNFKNLGPKVLLSFTNTRKSHSYYSFGKTNKQTNKQNSPLVLSYLTVSLLIMVFCEKTWVSCENSFEAAITLPDKLHIAL